MGVAISAGLVSANSGSHPVGDGPDQVLEWNQIFIDTLIATNTANSSSQRLGAIVHTAIFDAYNGIDRRYEPIFVQQTAPPGASRRAAVIAAAHTALVGLFPARQESSMTGMKRRSRRSVTMAGVAASRASAASLGKRRRAGRARVAGG